MNQAPRNHSETSASSIETLADTARTTINKLTAELNIPDSTEFKGMKIAIIRSRLGRRLAIEVAAPDIADKELFRDRPLDWWKTKVNLAKSNMLERATHPDANTHLIMVAAQHPLKNGQIPGDEFAIRLDEGARLYEQFINSGQPAEIYVPSSRHRDDKDGGPDDLVSLADAGNKYLQDNWNIPAEARHGQDWNRAYRGELGIYNGGQEVYAVASAFKQFPHFQDLHIVVSPGQADRETLYTVANGTLADLIIPPELTSRSDLYHSSQNDEALGKALTLLVDPYWLNSRLANKIRTGRVPADGIDSTLET